MSLRMELLIRILELNIRLDALCGIVLIHTLLGHGSGRVSICGEHLAQEVFNHSILPT